MTDEERVLRVFALLDMDERKRVRELIDKFEDNSYSYKQSVRAELETKSATSVGSYTSGKCPYCNR